MRTARRRATTSSLPAQMTCYDMAEIGAVLRARRKELEMTQMEAAAYCECSQRLISEMERGRGTVGIEKVMRYANGLGVDFTMSIRGRR